MTNELDEQMDGILQDAFVGLYMRAPATPQDDFDFVPVDDAHNVLHDSLKADIKELVEAALTKQLADIKAKRPQTILHTVDRYEDGYNTALTDYDKVIEEAYDK